MSAEQQTPDGGTGRLATLAVFRFGDRPYVFREILGWAEFTGRLEPTVAHLRRTQGALGSGQKVPRQRLQQATTEFRYRNHLITVAETQDWLDERSLTLDQLLRHLYRQFCRSDELPELSVDDWFAATPDSFVELWAELHFGGHFDVLVEDFIFRVAAEQRNPAVAIRAGSLQLNASPFSRLLLEGIIDDVRRLEGGYVQYSESVASPEACQRRLKSHRLELLRLEYQVLTYPDLHRAREAYYCIREDGEEPAALADRTGVLIRNAVAFVEDAPPELAEQLVSAEPGEVLAPITKGQQNGYQVCRLLRKTEPELGSPEVLTRLKRRLIAESLTPDIEKNLVWLPWRPVPESG